jgi:steroid delta-isomerase-like uncharacterized protein
VDVTHVAQALLDAYNQHDPAAVAKLYAADSLHVEMSHGGSKEGPHAIANGLAYLLQGFPDAFWNVHDLIAADDRAAVLYTLTGSLQADFGPYQAAGQRLELAGVLCLRQDGGQICHAQDYWDSASFARQMQAVAT